MKPETPGGTAALAKGLTLLDMVADAPEPPRELTAQSRAGSAGAAADRTPLTERDRWLLEQRPPHWGPSSG